MVMVVVVEAVAVAVAGTVKSAATVATVELGGVGDGAAVQVEQIDLVDCVLAAHAAVLDDRRSVLVELALKSRLVIRR